MEKLEDLLQQYEKEPLETYAEEHHLDKEKINRYGIHLYHGIRFDDINRLESILQSGAILCGKDINQVFLSKDGHRKYLYIDSRDSENCNMGEYISVMPHEGDMEFDVFVRRNIYFAIKASVDAYGTKYLTYDDYIRLRKSGLETKNLYSYAHNEYLVKDKISLKDVDYIGINPNYYAGDYNRTVFTIKDLLEHYKSSIPLINGYNDEIIYQYEEDVKKLTRNNRKTNNN